MSGTCKDCRHSEFTVRDYSRTTLARLGHCNRWHTGYNVEESDVKDNEVWVEDDEGWAMMIGPDFGCVLFEGKQ